jgi:F-type H+-transporting ATPase subunit delta
MKTEHSTVAGHYAEAVLKIAFEQKGDALADTVVEDLALINAVMEANPSFEVIFDHPAIRAEEKRKILVSAFGKKVNDLTMRLIELLLDKRRLNLLQPIERQYREKLNQHKRIVNADLVCAEKLDDKAIANIKARLTEHLGKRLDLVVKVDPSLIGGMVLRMGDQVLDGSLKGKLRQLERSLLSV